MEIDMRYPQIAPVRRLLLALLLLASCGACLADNASERPPNIVLVLTDDVGYADLHSYGHPYVETPSLDKLAAEGTRFTQHYVTGITCAPSRTGIMGGLDPARYPRLVEDFGFGDRVTITELLHQRGYQTGHFGKWNLGPTPAIHDGVYGIDTVRRIPPSRGPSAGRDDALFQEAIEFMRANRDRPFYVNIWGHATHYPVDPAPEFVAKFSQVHVNRADFSQPIQKKFDDCLHVGCNLDEAMRQYLGDVYSIDLNVGRLLDALDELGLSDNTIVVFSSDNGPGPVLSMSKRGKQRYAANMLGYTGVLRGGKHDQYEGGVRVPFIIRWPGHVPAGRVDAQSVTSFIDWMPTLAAIAGGTDLLPAQLDGEDISDIWLGNSRQRHKPLFWKTRAAGSAASMRDSHWKLHMPRRNGALELYDLSVDPGETNNVAEQHPDVVKRMEEQIAQWLDQLPSQYEKGSESKKQKHKGKKKKNDTST